MAAGWGGPLPGQPDSGPCPGAGVCGLRREDVLKGFCVLSACWHHTGLEGMKQRKDFQGPGVPPAPRPATSRQQ